MSYHRKRSGRVAMGDLLSSVESVAQTIGNVGSDPYLPEVICRVNQLHAINGGQAVPACAVTPPGLTGGVGMGRAMPVLRGYVFAEQNRWVYPVAIGAIVGVPFLLGYLFGKGH
jgi:hypothetical protein